MDFANVVTAGVDEDGGGEVRWEARLIVRSGKTVVTVVPTLTQALDLLARWPSTAEQRTQVTTFLSRLQSESDKGFIDADGLQAAWSHRVTSPTTTPPTILSLVAAS